MAIKILDSVAMGLPAFSGTANSVLPVFDAIATAGGWEKRSISATVSAYRPSHGTRRWLIVDDYSVNVFRCVTAETINADGTFTRISPRATNDTAYSEYKFCWKTGGTTPTAQRAWIAVVGRTCMYLTIFTDPGNVKTGNPEGLWFGDYMSQFPQDQTNSFLCGRAFGGAEVYANGNLLGGVRNESPVFGLLGSPLSGIHTGGSLVIDGPGAFAATANASLATSVFGNVKNKSVAGPGGLIDIVPLHAYDSLSSMRLGQMPGLYAPLSTPNLLDTFTLNDAGSRSFMVLPVQARNGANPVTGRICVETTASQTW